MTSPRSPRRWRNAVALFGGALAAALALSLYLAPPQPPQSVAVALPAAITPLPAASRQPLSSGRTLAPAPQPGLVERTADGLLPVVSPNGREAWRVYARPFDGAEPGPRIAIVISGLGLSRAATEEALRELPAAVTLSFLPDAAGAAGWLAKARRRGHETLLDLSLEPAGGPRQYAGPRVLLTSLEPSQNLDRLRWIMGRGTGYIGVMSYIGSRFAASPSQLRPILAELKARGLAFVDARTTGDSGTMRLAAAIGLPRGAADRILDAEISPGAIDQQLDGLAHLARRDGKAIGVGGAYPQTIKTVAAWAKGLAARGLVLAPLSAVLAR